jgi:hypothetical protein
LCVCECVYACVCVYVGGGQAWRYSRGGNNSDRAGSDCDKEIFSTFLGQGILTGGSQYLCGNSQRDQSHCQSSSVLKEGGTDSSAIPSLLGIGSRPAQHGCDTWSASSVIFMCLEHAILWIQCTWTFQAPTVSRVEICYSEWGPRTCSCNTTWEHVRISEPCLRPSGSESETFSKFLFFEIGCFSR